jgi:hypothetical protein
MLIHGISYGTPIYMHAVACSTLCLNTYIPVLYTHEASLAINVKINAVSEISTLRFRVFGANSYNFYRIWP